VRACGSGTVVRRGLWGDGGNTITVDHGDGIQSFYLHMSSFAVDNLTQVIESQLLGYSGGVRGEAGSGSSTGAHIHWHINDNGSVVDPAVYVAGHPTQTPIPTEPAQDEEEIMYFRREATGEIAMFGAGFKTGGQGEGRHIFGTTQEYEQWRSIVTLYNQEIDSKGQDQKGKRAVPPPISQVFGVSQANWALICGLYGV
jgi:hypothetical protein